MSKGTWKKETRARRADAEAQFNSKANQPENEIVTDPPGSGLPPPLPPLEPLRKPNPAVFDETKIKGGLGKAFCTATQGIANVTNYVLRNTPYRIEFSPVETEEGELWAEFAYPVIKSRLPDLEKNPVTVLVIMTGMILSGKIRIKKKEIPTNDGNNEKIASEISS